MRASRRTTTSSSDAGLTQLRNRRNDLLDRLQHIRARAGPPRDSARALRTRASPERNPNGGTSALWPSARRAEDDIVPTITGQLSTLEQATTRGGGGGRALLGQARDDGSLVHTEAGEDARPAAPRRTAGRSGPRAARSAPAHRDQQLYDHQAARARSRGVQSPTVTTTGTASGSRCASRCRRWRCCSPRPGGPGALPLPDQGARPGPGPVARSLRARKAARASRSTTAIRRARSARAIRSGANLIITNPDMLHAGSCRTTRPGRLFANLAAVVVDEAHVYRGVFGSHVANVLRRLRRSPRSTAASRA